MSGRHVLIVVMVVAALALPVTVYLERNANASLSGLKLAREQLQAQHRQIAGYRDHLLRYREYVEHLETFIDEARRLDIDLEHWDRHEVEIEDMFLSYDELAPFLDDMRHGRDSFFVPVRAELKTRPTVNREEAAALGHGKGDPDPGGVELSLKGEFLVRR